MEENMMSEEKTVEALEVVEQPVAPAPAVIGNNRYSMDRLQALAKFANTLGKSDYTSDKNKGHNALAAILLGDELGINPVQALCHIHVIAGKPNIDAQLAISLANRRAPIKGPIRYEETGEGDKLQCTAWAIDKATGEKVSYPMSIQDAKDAGWYGKSGSMWQKIPKLMLRYRSATYLIRSHYPEVMMGVYTRDEVEDIQAVQVETETEEVQAELGLK
jgi:hypothetical protein